MKRRGFSMVEVVVVVAIVAVLGGVIAWNFSSSSKRAADNQRARKVVNLLRSARSIAISKPEASAYGRMPVPSGTKFRSAGIAIESEYAYYLFADNDNSYGNEVMIERVDLSKSNLRIRRPEPGSQIRFRGAGTRDLNGPGELILEDPARGDQYKVKISGAGFTRLQ